MTVGVLVPTLNAEREIRACLAPVLAAKFATKVLVIDSESSDGTLEIVRELGADWLSIPRSSFNHGGTREIGRRRLGTDIVVMMTQDVVLTSSQCVASLVAPIINGDADVTYGRQLPRIGAGILESWPRTYNYPEESNTRTADDIPKFGVYTCFCSDSFAAYRQRSLDQIGGFEKVLTNEDYFAVAAILKQGGRIRYVAEATVFHSHRYNLRQEFRRNFDTGYVRGERPWIQQFVGHADRRGIDMVRRLIVTLAREAPWLIPYALLQNAAKWIGFRIGYRSQRAPRWVKQRLSGHRGYWVHFRSDDNSHQ